MLLSTITTSSLSNIVCDKPLWTGNSLDLEASRFTLDVNHTVPLYNNAIYGSSASKASFYTRVAMTCGGCMIVVEQAINCSSDHKNVWGTDVLPITDMCTVYLCKHCNTDWGCPMSSMGSLNWNSGWDQGGVNPDFMSMFACSYGYSVVYDLLVMVIIVTSPKLDKYIALLHNCHVLLDWQTQTL